MSRPAYLVTLTSERDWLTLCWLADRGYDGGFLDAAELVAVSRDGERRLLGLAEPDAWEFGERAISDREAFLACNGSRSLEAALCSLVLRIC